MKSNSIYLDYNATTPIATEVFQSMLPLLQENFGNPSSSHWYGTQAKRAVEQGRSQIAAMLGCQTKEVIITSGGTEANNFAIKGIAEKYRSKGNHIIVSSVEHPSVTQVGQYLSNHGYDISIAPVDKFGRVSIDKLEKLITPQTILLSIMHANNEVGTIQPITEISRIAHKNGILIHTDAAQSVGKIPVLIDELQVDLLSIAGHKIYAPKGIGALYIRSGVEVSNFIHGAGHEMGKRAGTENVAFIAGLGKACELIKDNLEYYSSHMRSVREHLEQGLLESRFDVRINGHPEQRLPNTLNVSFKGIKADVFLRSLDSIAASAGAACHSDQVKISGVLEAMNIPTEYAMGAVRFSTGRGTSIADIEKALSDIATTIDKMRSQPADHQVNDTR
jgi:cysteine desulfurase NifS